jgi:hypothetical protein
LVIEGLPQRSIEVGDTLTLVATAINRSGDTVPDPGITWVMVASDTGQPSFTLDSMTGLVTGLEPGAGRVRPRLPDVYTLAIIDITVTPAPDSIGPAGGQQITMAASDSASAAMAVSVFDLTADSATAVALPDKPVQFYLVDPPPGSADAAGFYLTTSESGQQGEEQHQVAVTTDEQGVARAVLKRTAGSTLPDSAVVDATAVTAAGDTVAGSPVRFVVLFAAG